MQTTDVFLWILWNFQGHFFLQTTSGEAVFENLRDVFVRQSFSLLLRLCLRLISFHSYSFATSMAKMSSDIFFSNVSLKDTSYRKNCYNVKNCLQIVKNQAVALGCSVTLLKRDSSTGGFLWISQFAKFPRASLLQKTTGRLLLDTTQDNL